MASSLLFALLLVTTTTISSPSLVTANSSCRDMSKCNDYYNCTDNEAAYRSGHLCHGYPFYLGRYPLSALEWQRESKIHSCLEALQDGPCTRWTDDEYSHTEVTKGYCVCDVAEQTYCAKWYCNQEEVSLCQSTEIDTGTSCCSEGVCTPKEMEGETSTCECTAVDGGMCARWYCEEVDIDGFRNAEHEWYECTRRAGVACVEWKGRTNSVEEFELNLCRCTSNDGRKCNAWTCFEQGLDYYHHKVAYIAVFVILALPAFIWLLAIIYGRFLSVGALFLVVWMLGFTVLAVFLAGVPVFVLSVAITLSVWLVADAIAAFNGINRSLLRKLAMLCIGIRQRRVLNLEANKEMVLGRATKVGEMAEEDEAPPPYAAVVEGAKMMLKYNICRLF